MHKKLTLLIFLFPTMLFAQIDFTNGAITIDFGKKHKFQDSVQQQQQDSIENSQTIPGSDVDDYNQSVQKHRKQKENSQPEIVDDWKKNGIFKAIFHAGINGSQVDGDGYAGYNLMGFQGGIGALVRFHKYFSTSIEINYTMKGAKQKFIESAAGTDSSTRQLYRVQWDYIELPISINVQDKKLVMFSLGLAPAVMVRYRERNENGDDDTNAPPDGQPRRFDLSAFGSLHFLIQQHYGIGLKFSYSLLKIRGPQYPGLTRVAGEYNNVLSLNFMYILDTVKKKK
ncbi:MAG TPA: outer membrane beta-barrel protein [Chitinophagales bacterium]|nr:outer membrane beta-barrel protein [Chitinophagales bacterium]